MSSFKIKTIIYLFWTAFLLAPSFLFAYDSGIAHPGISGAAIVYHNSWNSNKISKEQGRWISEGASDEDADPRYLNHFYNPETGLGLDSFLIKGKSAKTWAQNQGGAGEGDFDEASIFEYYKEEDYQNAFKGVGHILHLIEDMSVPAHTRNDMHPFGDPYEAWVRENAKVYIDTFFAKKIKNLDQVFDELSTYSHDNFVSKDTVNENMFSECDVKRIKFKNEYYDYVHCSGYVAAMVKEKFGFIKYSIDDKVNEEYWKLLHPVVLSYSVGVLDYFMTEFNKIDKQKKIDLLGWFKAWWTKPEKKSVDAFGFNNIENWDGGTNFKVVTWDESFKEIKDKREALSAAAGYGSIVKKENGNYVDPKDWNGENFYYSPIIHNLEAKMREKLYPESGLVLGIVEEEENENTNVIIKEIEQFKTEDGDDSPKEDLIKIKNIIDGDTIELDSGERIRYIGIDTPELNSEGSEDDECLAWVARERNRVLLESGSLRLVKDPLVNTDKYGRLLRYVYVGDVFINAVLVREGLADDFFCEEGWINCPVVSESDKKEIIISAALEAKENGRGIFSDICADNNEPLIAEETDNAFKDQDDNQNEGELNHSLDDLSANQNELKLKPFPIIILGGGGSPVVEEEISEEKPDILIASSSLVDDGATSSDEGFSVGGEEYKKLGLNLVSHPPAISSSSNASFVFEVSGEYDELSCFLNEIKQDTCSTSLEVYGLGDGGYDFYVEIKKASSSAGSAYSWQVDTKAPISMINDFTQDFSDLGFTVSWSGNDGIMASSSGIAGYDILYKIDNGGWIDWILATSATSSLFFENIEADAKICFASLAADEAGNAEVIGDKKTCVNKRQKKLDHIVISQVQVGGISARDEFVEIYNPTDGEINLLGYRLSRMTDSGREYNLLTNFEEIALPANAYYLIAHNEYKGMADPDEYYSTTESVAKNNTVVLYSDQGETVVDMLGFGNASNFETGIPENPSDKQSLKRKSTTSVEMAEVFIDSDNNKNDFEILSLPNPKNFSGIFTDRRAKEQVYNWYFDAGVGEMVYEYVKEDNIYLESDEFWRTSDWGPRVSMAVNEFNTIDRSFSEELESGNFSVSFWYNYFGMDEKYSSYYLDIEKTITSGGEDFIEISDGSGEYYLGVKFNKNNGGSIRVNSENFDFVYDFEENFDWNYFTIVFDSMNGKIILYSQNGLVFEESVEADLESLGRLVLNSSDSNYEIYNLSIWNKALSEQEARENLEENMREIENGSGGTPVLN